MRPTNVIHSVHRTLTAQGIASVLAETHMGDGR
jgi:hypothetical protein